MVQSQGIERHFGGIGRLDTVQIYDSEVLVARRPQNRFNEVLDAKRHVFRPWWQQSTSWRDATDELGTRASCLVVAYEYGVPPGKADLVPEKPRVACSMQVPPTNIASRVIPEKLGR